MVEFSSKPSFGEYGRQFQEQIFQALLHDPKWAEQLLDVFDTSYFDLKYLVYLSERYFEHGRKYKVFPSLGLLLTIIKDELKQGKDNILKSQVVEYLQKIKNNPDPGDLPFVKEKTLDFCRKQALKGALEQAVEYMHTEKYESCVEVVKKAVLAGTAPNIGHDFFEDHESRFTKFHRDCIATGIDQLDQKEILNGGLGKGEISVIVAATGVGKCSKGDTIVTVQYEKIIVNGVEYDPWDKLLTQRGEVCAIDLLETDEHVITRNSTQHIKLSDLFSKFGMLQSSPSNSEDDETITSIEKFNIKVLSKTDHVDASAQNAFYKISGLRLTKEEDMIEVNTKLISLKCSPDHIIATTCGWLKAKDLLKCDFENFAIHTVNGLAKITSVRKIDDKERLYDLQVDEIHSYYTNGILSHNSHFLTFLGANALLQGKNVVHYTMELSEQQIGIRYDSCLCDVDSNEVIDRKEDVLAMYENMKLGKLFIKQYPPNTATVYTIRSHLEKLSLTKGIKPDMVIIDYADIMRSTRQFDALRHELKLVYEEIRGMAIELGLTVVTASQSNKEGSSADVIDMSNMSESYGKAMVADVVISISRKAEEKATGAGRLFIAKNRAGKDGLLYNCTINTARSKFSIGGPNITWEQEKNADDREAKRRLREKLEELEHDKLVNPARNVT